MSDTSSDPQVDQITDILRDFVFLKYRAMAILPDDLARAKRKLDESRPSGGRAADYEVYYRVGIVLSRQETPATMRELSEALDVPLSTATRIVDWLVEGRYAERLADPNDRRIVRVALTTSGQQFYEAIDEFLRQRVKLALVHFSVEERGVLVPLLRKLMMAMLETMR